MAEWVTVYEQAEEDLLKMLEERAERRKARQAQQIQQASSQDMTGTTTMLNPSTDPNL